ncbi:hypothetical protein BC830DRAFT_475571 [Chytriomyces sp. MP71]|nr:hypothetical protein BC830DRAFT_475571 [Chytriomyces sp. MP71]
MSEPQTRTRSVASVNNTITSLSFCVFVLAVTYVINYESRSLRGASVAEQPSFFPSLFTTAGGEVEDVPKIAPINMLPSSLRGWLGGAIVGGDIKLESSIDAKKQKAETSKHKAFSGHDKQEGELVSRIKQLQDVGIISKQTSPNEVRDTGFFVTQDHSDERKEKLKAPFLSYFDSWAAAVFEAAPSQHRREQKQNPELQRPKWQKVQSVTTEDDQELARVLATLVKSAKKGSLSSARLLKKLLAADEELASQQSSGTLISIEKPLKKALKSQKSWNIFVDEVISDKEVEPIGPFLLSLQSKRDSLARAVVSTFTNALASSKSTPDAANENESIFVDFFKHSENAGHSNSSSLDRFLAFIRGKANEGKESAKHYLANVEELASKNFAGSSSDSIFKNLTPENAAAHNSLLTYFLGATSLGSSSTASVLSQIVEPQQENSRSSVFNMESFFIKQNNEGAFEDSKLNSVGLLCTLQKAASLGSKSAEVLMSKITTFDDVNTMDSREPKLAALLKKANEKSDSRIVQDEPVALLLASLQRAVEKGNGVASALLKKFFNLMVPFEESNVAKNDKSADASVFADFFQSQASRQHHSESLNGFLSFVEKAVSTGNAQARAFTQSLQSMIVNDASQDIHNADLNSVVSESVKANIDESPSFKEFLRYLGRQSTTNPVSAGVMADILLSATKAKSRGPIFVPQTWDSPEFRVLNDITKFSFDSPDYSLERQILENLKKVKENLLSFVTGNSAESAKWMLHNRDFVDASQKSAGLDSIKQKWEAITKPQNPLSSFFDNQAIIGNGSDVPPSVLFLTSFLKAAREGSNSARHLLSQLFAFEKSVSRDNESNLAQMLSSATKKSDSMWVQREPVTPFLATLKKAANEGNTVAMSILDKFMGALTSSGPDSKVFADYFFESTMSSRDTEEPLGAFLAFVKESVESGSKAAKRFVSSLEASVSSKTEVSKDENPFSAMFAKSFKNRKQPSAFSDLFNYLTSASAFGNPTSAGLLADIFMDSRQIGLSEEWYPKVVSEAAKPVQLLTMLSKRPLERSDPTLIQRLASMLRDIKVELKGFLVEDEHTFSNGLRSNFVVGKSELKDFFISQDAHTMPAPEPLRILEAMKKASKSGNDAAKMLLLRLLSVDEAISSKNQDKPLLHYIKEFPEPNESTTWVEQEPVARFVSSLKKATDLGSPIAASILNSFFGALVSGGQKPTEQAADHVFARYFENSRARFDATESEPIKDFIHHVESLVFAGNKYATKYVASLSENIQSQDPRGFKDVLISQFSKAPPRAESTSIASFFEYLLRSASSGNSNAAGILSDMIISGQSLFSTSSNNVLKSIFASNSNIFESSISNLFKLFKEVIAPGTSQGRVESLLQNLKSVIANQAKPDQFVLHQDRLDILAKNWRKGNDWSDWALRKVKVIKEKTASAQAAHPSFTAADSNISQLKSSTWSLFAHPEEFISISATSKSIGKAAYDVALSVLRLFGEVGPSIKSFLVDPEHHLAETSKRNLFTRFSQPDDEFNWFESFFQRVPSSKFQEFIKTLRIQSQTPLKSPSKKNFPKPSSESRADELEMNWAESFVRSSQSQPYQRKIEESSGWLKSLFANSDNPVTQSQDRHGSLEKAGQNELRSSWRERMFYMSEPGFQARSDKGQPSPRFLSHHGSNGLKYMEPQGSASPSFSYSRTSHVDCTIDLLPNNDFKTGKLTYWEVIREPSSEGDVVVASEGDTLTYSGHRIPYRKQRQSKGTPFIVFDNEGAGSYVLFRDITPIDGDILRFRWNVTNSAKQFYILDTMTSVLAPNQQFRVDLYNTDFQDWFQEKDVRGPHLATVLSPQKVKSLAGNGWQTTSFDLSQFAGKSVRLAFRSVNNQDLLRVAIQEVSVKNIHC